MINNKTARLLPAVCASGILTLSLAAGNALAADNNPAFTALFEQARYWHEKSHNDLAGEALKKVLLVDANNNEALYLMALWAQQSGDLTGAAQWRDRLAKANPQAPQLQALSNASQVAQIPKSRLSLARQQARSGNINAALETWQSLFNGGTPPPGLAPEYYLTMAGDTARYDQALSGLRQAVAQNPQDNAARVALGKVLTYREGTRREGIGLLEQMASGNQEADTALRQALLWFSPQTQDEPSYTNWMQRHPKDTAVLARYRQSAEGAAMQSGFSELNSGDLATAKARFEQVLQSNPNDPDALAGMGYIAQRQGDYAGAAQYLQRSASQGGEQSASRQNQAADADFYGKLSQAQQAYKQGNISQALALSAPLAGQTGERGNAAKLFRADVLRHNKDYPQAEQTLRALLQDSPDNAAAKENLYYVLREQNKTDQAQSVLRTLSPALQARLQPRAGGGSPGDPLRRQAQQAADRGDTEQAIALLRQGVNRVPGDPWLRLDLARQLDKNGNRAEATSVIEPLYRPGAGASSLYAAALFLSDRGAWQQAGAVLARIPPASRNRDMNSLARRITFNGQMATAESYLATGNINAARNTLRAMGDSNPDSPADAGKLAQLLAKSGDLSGAVAVVQRNMARGVQGNAGDYADQIAVLNQAGMNAQASQWLANPELQARSTPTQLAGLQNGYVINEADRLRESGNYAAAYDRLIRAMQQDPQNTDLMFAMARLYQSGKMNKEAGVVYDYLMTRDTPTQDARAGAIDVALAADNVERARQLAAGLRDTSTPQRKILLARIEEADGNHQQALALLRSARGQVLGLQSASVGSGPGSTPVIGGMVLADNPFSTTSTTSRTTPSASVYGISMPWQVDQQSRDPQTAPPGTVRPDIPVETAQSSQLRQIDQMIQQLDEKTASWVRSDMSVRGRDGENGLSKLTEGRVPLQWSTVPFGDARLELNVTPVTLSAGSPSGDASRRFGTGAIMQGQNTAALGHSTYANDQLEDAPSQGSQNESGVEVGATLRGDSYKLDIGTTPLGPDLSSVVGGVQWSPQLTDYVKLIFTGERRAVTDSLLSYVGAFDKFTGKHWGQVTRNGGSVQLSYDDGDAGFYLGGGGWSYIGDNIQSNSSVTGSAGFYLRPLRSDDRELKTGISLSYMDFSKNLSNFSYGHGGYFSPQNYVSVSFPVDYSQTFSNWKMSVGGALGYQSYSQDSAPYFPGNSSLQSQLEDYVNAGQAKEAWYDGKSENGTGYNLHANVDYNVNKDLMVGGKVTYDTFGDYNESAAQVYFRYMFGDR
ncbi:cellulose biosynthesis protein BcsC [Shimwellia pseudoproteus]|uniref:cellulose biosynthesis protein BcsC n=1 Tax=Shimwellia pseudoproteus TaxID=570012 RepID=UPI0018EB6BEB|nr:cellulose biosynthesis protein BcsC [Shimwellia pseudoproteus]